MRRVVLTITGFLGLANAAPANATDRLDLCANAAAQAERQYELPSGLLQAISLVETGRSQKGEHVAWPWTVNVNGQGRYFNSKQEAHAFAKTSAKLGVTSMDIGCFQINTKWHGEHFSTIDAMFDPEATADYAASFLKTLQSEFGDWDNAVQKYHSRTAAKGAYYGRKVNAALEKITPQLENDIPVASLFSPTPLTRLQPGNVELTIFSPVAPILREVKTGPLISTENASWK